MLKFNDHFYQDNLVRHSCSSCNKDFIVGEESVKDCKPHFPKCPYCGSSDVMKESWTKDEHLEEMNLGCVGIYIEKE